MGHPVHMPIIAMLIRQMAMPSFTSDHHRRLNAAISLLTVRKMSPALPSASQPPWEVRFPLSNEDSISFDNDGGRFLSLLCSSTTEVDDLIPARLREIEPHPCKLMRIVDRFTQSSVNFSPLFALSVVSTYQEVNKI